MNYSIKSISSNRESTNSTFISNKRETRSSFFTPVIQPRLSVNAPGDIYEQEADRIADEVMRMPEPQLQRKCAECEAEEKLQRKPLAGDISSFIQRKGTNGGEVNGQVASSLQSAKSGGQPLPESTQSWMESRFGMDFGGVRIHTDYQAIQLSRELGAQAFTHGSDIYFNRGKFAPETSEGKRLLAHELTHVVQQGGKSYMVQKAEPASTVTAATALGWCLSGATVSVLIDQVIQSGGWVLDRLTSGRWNVRQNWCKTILSALFGCVFGMVGGSIARMIFTEIAGFSIAQLARWVHQKLVTAGLTFLAGKWGVMIAKTGCAESNEPANIDPP